MVDLLAVAPDPVVAAPAASALYEQDQSRQAGGAALHPGGLALTACLLQQCDLPPGARLLDAGCGPGASLDWLRAQGTFDAVGVDLSAALLRQAANLQLDVARAPLGNLPFPATSFEAILLECSLSASMQPGIAAGGSGWAAARAALGEAQRVLRPGGWLLLSDLYARRPEGIAALRELPAAGCLRSLLDLAGLRQELEELGFTVCFWEDHSETLPRPGSQISQAYGSPQSFWEQFAGQAVDAFDLALCTGRARPGYFILAAQKN